MEGANLTNVCLAGADLTKAVLASGNLSHADLFRPDLLHDDLSEASLVDADLTGANLEGARFDDADFQRANLTDTNFKDARLSKAKARGISQAQLDKACGIPADLPPEVKLSKTCSGAPDPASPASTDADIKYSLSRCQHPVKAAENQYVFALVPANTNNPFFDQARDGCKKAEEELDGQIECLYDGPSEHAGAEEQVQVVYDLIAKHVDGIAVSVANADLMVPALERALKSGIPVLTWDSDLPAHRELRIAYIGTHNYDLGVELAKLVMKTKPKGGTICIQSGDAAAPNHNERMQGIRDTLSGRPSKEAPGMRLTGQNGWKEVDECPQYTHDDYTVALHKMEQILGNYPTLDAFVLTGGFPELVEQEYKQTASNFKFKITNGSLAMVVGDTLPMQIDELKLGLASGNVGQRPFDMGYRVMYALKHIKDGKGNPKDPTYTGMDICTPKT